MRKAIQHLKKSDPVLARVIGRVGAYKIQYRDPSFETLVRSIVYQQLSGRVAKVIFDRLENAVPDKKITRTVKAEDRLHSGSGQKDGARRGEV